MAYQRDMTSHLSRVLGLTSVSYGSKCSIQGWGSLLDNAPNQVVGCIIQKRMLWERKYKMNLFISLSIVQFYCGKSQQLPQKGSLMWNRLVPLFLHSLSNSQNLNPPMPLYTIRCELCSSTQVSTSLFNQSVTKRCHEFV